MKLIIASLIAFSSLSALAQDCSKYETTYDLKICESKRLEKEDKRLNQQYSIVVKKLDSIGNAKLKKAQRAWIAFRDADCDLQADEARGGSAEGLIAVSCLAEKTKERADFLKDIAEFR